MAFQVSPGVLVTEKDLTNIVPAVSTSSGGIVLMTIPIFLQKNENHLIINSIRKLIDKFFKMIKIERF